MQGPIRGQHWAEGIHDTVLSVSAKSPAPFSVDGGAEEGLFVLVGDLVSPTLTYLRGNEKLQKNEIILELQGRKIAGLTSLDVTNWLLSLCKTGGPLSLRTVRPGLLTTDLREYLSMRFPKGSIDHDLQNTIRDNVYLKTVPCTTRPPRSGEVNGVDYRFVSVEEFAELDRQGDLLESGIFEGNYYGTPKPKATATNDNLSDSPRSKDDSRPNYRVEMAPLFGATSEQQSGHQHQHGGYAGSHAVNGEYQMNGYGDMNGGESTSVDPLGPLPTNWEIAYTDYGEKYFIDHNTGSTHWTDPRYLAEQRPSVSDSMASTSSDLPEGWEKVEDPQYGTYYVDHINKRTQYDKPVVPNGTVMSKGGGENPTASSGMINRRVNSVPEIPPGPPHHFPNSTDNPHRGLFTRNPEELRGDLITTRVLKGPRGLGFTLIGNDAGSPVEEFLQIKSIIPQGPAAKDGRLRMGDILVYINDSCVLGSTQEDAIKIFQSIQVGETVTIQVCRGYPLLFDPLDEIVTQDAYSALPPHSSGDSAVGSEFTFPSSRSDATLRPAETHTVHIEKGDMGFGFTIADSPYGQRVKKILDRGRCRGLTEGDVLCEINGFNVRKMSHSDIVDVLRDCPIGQRAVILIQRNPKSSTSPPFRDPLAGRPPVVPNKPRSAFSENGRPHSYHPAFNDPRRARTPTTEYMQRGGPMPVVKPRSKTPGPVPPRPAVNKPNGYLPSGNYKHHRQSFGDYEQDPIYQNLGRTRDRSQSPAAGTQSVTNRMRATPSLGTSAFATPTYVPRTVYANNRYGQVVGNGMERSTSAIHGNLATTNGHEPQHHYEYTTVNLIRHPTGFGFRVVGGTEEGTQAIVGEIVPGGAAELDGRLQTRDEIVEIDGNHMIGATHATAVQLMQRAGNHGHVKLVVRRPSRGPMSHSLSMPLNGMHNQVPTRPPVVPLQYPYDVTVTRNENEGFGFVIMSSVNKNGSNIEKNFLGGGYARLHPGYPIIGRIIEGSPAQRCGQLGVGDRIIAVNGINILNVHHGDIVNLIKDSGLSVTLSVGAPDDAQPSPNTSFTGNGLKSNVAPNGTLAPLERQESSDSVLEAIRGVGPERYTETEDYRQIDVSDPPSPDRLHLHRPYQDFFTTYVPPATLEASPGEEHFAVELSRGTKGFGFSIRGGSEFQQELFVLRIAEGGPAHLDARLRVGDKLIEINGISTKGMSHERAIQLIKGENTVKLLVRREPIPPSIDDAMSMSSAAEAMYARGPSVSASSAGMAEAIQASWSRKR